MVLSLQNDSTRCLVNQLFIPPIINSGITANLFFYSALFYNRINILTISVFSNGVSCNKNYCIICNMLYVCLTRSKKLCFLYSFLLRVGLQCNYTTRTVFGKIYYPNQRVCLCKQVYDVYNVQG